MSKKDSWQFVLTECFEKETCHFGSSEQGSRLISDAVDLAKSSRVDLQDFNKEVLLHVWEWSEAQNPAADPILVYRLMREALEVAKSRWAT